MLLPMANERHVLEDLCDGTDVETTSLYGDKSRGIGNPTNMTVFQLREILAI